MVLKTRTLTYVRFHVILYTDDLLLYTWVLHYHYALDHFFLHRYQSPAVASNETIFFGKKVYIKRNYLNHFCAVHKPQITIVR